MSASLTKELLHKFRDLVYERYGIHYAPLKLYLLQAKLEKIESKVGDLQAFYHRVRDGDGPSVDILLKDITVGHTFFFREESHFSLMVQDILSRKLESPVIWCAASSTGEEPYSIAITLLEKGVEDFTIVSSDVNPRVLAAMNKGVYGAGRFSNTSRHVILKYFTKVDEGTYRIRRELRQYLKIKKLNLHEDIHFDQPFDYVFCRNVMIYFDDVGRRKVVDNLVQNLKVGGLLFVGHTEALLNTPVQLTKESQSLFRRTM